MKTVIVTGSARGIGASLIRKYAKGGYNTVILYNTNKLLADNLAKEVMDTYHNKTIALKCDVTNEEEIKLMIKEVTSVFGNIDILINNAAYACDNYIDNKTKEEFMKVLETNLVAPFIITKNIYKYMNNGIIVNISSTDSIDTYNDISIDYCCSKAGLNMLTKILAMGMSNLKVIAVLPNWVRTDSVLEMNEDFLNSELKRIGQTRLQEPEEVAEKIYNITQDKNLVSGSIIRIDGDVRC